MDAFQPTKEQLDAITARGGSLLVSAAAGSGKTRVLVERLMNYVTGEHVNINSFLIITYTKAAATELRGKIVEELGKRIAKDPKNRHLQRQATLVYQAEIKTIHGFCTNLIRENAPLLGVDPSFRVADEGESRILKRQALERVLEAHYDTIPESDPFYALVETLSAGRDDSRLIEIVLDTYEKIQSHPYPDRWFKAQLTALTDIQCQDAGDTIWGEMLLLDLYQQCRYWLSEMRKALSLIQEDPDLKKGYEESFFTTISSMEHLAQQTKLGWDAVWSFGPVEFPRLKAVRNCVDKELQEQIREIRDRCKKQMEKATERFTNNSEELLSDLSRIAPLAQALFKVTMAFESTYQQDKKRRRLLDFNDLEHIAVKALLDEETGMPTELAKEMGKRYREILVDEYQDTNSVQNAIFEALSHNGKNLFFVGDVKQSIYRFRLADPTLFLEKYQTYLPYDLAEEGQNSRIILSQNFRSRAQVLEAANFVFSNVMSTEFGEMEYGPDEALHVGAQYPEGADANVELNVLDLFQEDSDEDTERPERSKAEAEAVADRIQTLLRNGFTIFDRELNRMRPVTPGDIVILLRAPGTVLYHYVTALGDRDIPCITEGGSAFLTSVEVETALSALAILDNPRQDVPLISVLRSPLFGFSADLLADIRLCAPEADFYTALETAALKLEPCRLFLEELKRLRSQVADLSSDLLLWQMYTRWNFFAVFGALTGGEERQENLVMLYIHARRLAQAGHRSLFSFLNYVRRLQDNGGDLAPPGSVGATGGVQIMSIHKSKGLEFPVVILAGLSKQFNRTDLRKPILVHAKLGLGPKLLELDTMVEYPTLPRWAVERQLEFELMSEELRLLYVAMTRAKEKLILFCALPNAHRTLPAMAKDARCPMAPQALLLSSSMAGWILPLAMTRPDGGALRAIAGREDISLCQDPGPDWSIQVLTVQTNQEARSQIDATPRAAPFREIPQDLTFPSYPYLAASDTPSKVTATSLKGRLLDAEIAEDAPPPRRKQSFLRPRFITEDQGLTPAQKGTALHLAMQYIQFGQTGCMEDIVEELQRMKEMRLLTPQQAEAVPVEKIAALFASPLGQAMRAARSLRREFKFSVLVPAELYFTNVSGETVLLQGVIDCFWEEEDGLILVDFKTDSLRPGESEQRARSYKPQLDAYSKALLEITGRPVQRRILYFFSTGEAVEVN